MAWEPPAAPPLAPGDAPDSSGVHHAAGAAGCLLQGRRRLRPRAARWEIARLAATLQVRDVHVIIWG